MISGSAPGIFGIYFGVFDRFFSRFYIVILLLYRSIITITAKKHYISLTLKHYISLTFSRIFKVSGQRSIVRNR